MAHAEIVDSKQKSPWDAVQHRSSCCCRNTISGGKGLWIGKGSLKARSVGDEVLGGDVPWLSDSFMAFFWGPGQQLLWYLRSPGSVLLCGDSSSLLLQQLGSGLQKEYCISFGNSAKKERKFII